MPHEIIKGNLVIDQMKQIAYDAMLKSKNAVLVEMSVWAFRCEDEPSADTRIYYACNRSEKKFKNLAELASHVYKGRRADD